MKALISQPMLGKTAAQINAERASTVDFLNCLGFEVVDTALTDLVKGENEALFYFAKGIEIMSTVDVVVFIGDWQTARGCKLEREVALAYKKIVVENILPETFLDISSPKAKVKNNAKAKATMQEADSKVSSIRAAEIELQPFEIPNASIKDTASQEFEDSIRKSIDLANWKQQAYIKDTTMQDLEDAILKSADFGSWGQQ